MTQLTQRLKSWEGLLLAAVLIIVAANMALSPEFLTVSNQINLFQLSIEKIIVALIMTFIIINADPDATVLAQQIPQNMQARYHKRQPG